MSPKKLSASARSWLSAALVVLWFVILLAPGLVRAERVLIGGAGSAMGSMRALADAFKKTHPDFQYEVLPNAGTSGGIKGVANGVLHIGLATRLPFENENASGIEVAEYARTPLLFVANKPDVKGLSYSDITDIYAGRLTKWPDGSPIRLVLRPVRDADTLIFSKSSPEMGMAIAAAHKRKGLSLAITSDETMEMVPRVKGSLCSTTLAVIARTPESQVNVMAINGVEPTLAHLKNGTYPYFKPLYVAHDPKRSSALVKRFVEFVRSTEGNGLLAQWGSVAVPKTLMAQK